MLQFYNKRNRRFKGIHEMMTRLINFTCVLCVGMFLVSSNAIAGDWPQWLGSTRNGVADESIEPWQKTPPVIWKKPVGNGFSVPVVANGTVFVHAAVADQEAEQVTAYDLQSGDQKWQTAYPRAKYQSQLGVGPRATPSVADGRLVTFGITGELTCFQSETGEKLWQINPYRDNDVPTPGFGVCSSPVVFGGRIYIPVGGSGSAIAAYELETGKLAWKGLDEPPSSASPILRTVTHDDQQVNELIVQTTLRIVGLDPNDGAVRWEHPLVFQPSGVSPTPLVVENRLVCTTQDTGTLTVQFPEHITGEAKTDWWQQDLTSYFSTGTVGANDNVFLVTNVLMPLPRTDLRCINVANGEEKWLAKGLGYFHIGLISLKNNRLLILTDGGKLILAEATGDEFTELCQAEVCRGTFVNPVLSNGYLILRDDQELLCVNLNAGE